MEKLRPRLTNYITGGLDIVGSDSMYIVILTVKSSNSRTLILVVRNAIQGGGGQLEGSNGWTREWGGGQHER